MKSDRIKASEYIYSKLEHKIDNEYYKAGDKLPSEQDIAKYYGVSRNSVRSALNKLATLGIVESFQGKGTFVKDKTSAERFGGVIPVLFRESNDYISLTNLRIAVEEQSAGLAAVNASRKDIIEMNEILKKMEAEPENLILYQKYDTKFHTKIAECSRNALLFELSEMVRKLLNEAAQDFISDYGTFEGIYNHRRILEAIKIADAGNARHYMYEHVNTCLERYAFIELPTIKNN